jgi:uncharacterized protein
MQLIVEGVRGMTRKSIFMVMVWVLMTGTLFAEVDTQELAIEYLTLSKAKETFDATIDAYADQMAASNPKADKAQIRELLNRAMGWDALREPTIQLVMRTFSTEELKGINDFYKTPAGKAFAEKSPLLSSELSKLIAENMKKTLSPPPQ